MGSQNSKQDLVRLGDWMAQIGFRKDASESTKRALLKNIIQQSNQEIKMDVAKSTAAPKKVEQLCFDLDIPSEESA